MNTPLPEVAKAAMEVGRRRRSRVSTVAYVLVLVAFSGCSKRSSMLVVVASDANVSSLFDGGDAQTRMQDGGDAGRAGADGGTGDASLPTDADASDPATDAGSEIDAVASLCADAGAVSTLTMIPSDATFFRQLSSPCTSLGSDVLIRNGGMRAVQIRKLAASPTVFTVSSAGLPLDVDPGETVTVKVAYAENPLGVAEGARSGSLTVVTSDGCAHFKIHGLASRDDSVISYSAYAVDFGAVSVGAASEPRTVSLRVQHPVGKGPTRFSGFSTSPSKAFEILSQPDPEHSTPGSCETLSLRVVFVPPNTPGAVEGELGWEATTETPQGEASALVVIPLFGSALAR